MQLAKNIGITIAFIGLGIALGLGLFYAQRAYFNSQKATTSQASTAQPTPTSQPQVKASVAREKYINVKYGFSLTLPTNTFVLEQDLTGYPTGFTAQSGSFLLKGPDQSLTKTDTTFYALQKDASSLLSLKTYERRLQNMALPNAYVDSSFIESNSGDSQFTHKRYLAAGTYADDVYQFESDSLYLLVVHEVNSSGHLYTASEIQDVLNSFTLKGASATASPTNSTTNSPLLSSPKP